MKDVRWVIVVWATGVLLACSSPRQDGADAAGTDVLKGSGGAMSMPGAGGTTAPTGMGGAPGPTGGTPGVDSGESPGGGGTTGTPTGGTPGNGGNGGTSTPDGGSTPDVPGTTPVCQANQTVCKSETELDSCSADGLKLTTSACAAPNNHCAGGRCVACFKDSHCPAPPACKRVTCDVPTGACVTVAAPGLSCEGKGVCSPEGFCRKPVSVGAFSIDATEVTKAQYADFLAAKGTDTSGQAPYCGFNTTFTPTNEWPPTPEQLGLPVNWVDWCDAVAFCKWAGKRLCGRIGGGSTPHNDYDKPAVSQWHAACTANGTRRFPYGNSYDPTKCVGDKSATGGYSGKAQPVGSFAGCEGGFPGIFDLSGNLVEWEDSCVAYTGGSDFCRERGNSFQGPDDLDSEPGYFAACNMNNNNPRNSTNNTRGFRCCQDN
jgi:hypothetical protein